jgi:hypothetical protein
VECPGRPRPRAPLEAVARALVRQERGRDLADDLAVVEGPEEPVAGHLADDGVVELPAAADRGHLLRGRGDGDHPFLALGDHDLPGLEVVLAERDAVELHVDAGAVARHLGERRREAPCAAVLERGYEAALDELEARLDHLLAGEGVADLHRRALLLGRLAELLAREDARAADPVAAGRGAVDDDGVPLAARARAHQPRDREEADAHRVHERVVRVPLVEDALASDRRDADRVAVVADATDGAVERPTRAAEPQPVEQRDRPRSHRDDVAEDPADPCRRPLEGLDGGRVVVALDLEGDGQPLAEVEHAGVLAGALNDPRTARREPLEERCGMLVPAVLGPEEREDRELEVVRVAVEQFADTVELPVGQPEGPVERLFRDRRQGAQSRGGRGRTTCSLESL